MLLKIFFLCLICNLEFLLCQETPIKRTDYFRPLDYTNVKLSHDGRWLAYVGVHKNVPNIFVKMLPNGTSKLLTMDQGRGVKRFDLARDNRTILFQQDLNGDENFKLYSVNVETGERKTISTPAGAQALILATSRSRPYEIAVGMNQRDPRYHDAYLLDLRTGELKLLMENNYYKSLVFNDQLQAKIGYNLTDSASLKFFYFHDNGTVELIKHSPPFDQIGTTPIRIDSEGMIYWIDNENVDKSGLTRLNPKNKRREVLYNAKKADVVDQQSSTGRGVVFHPITSKPLWLYEYYEKPELILLDQSYRLDFENLKRIQTASSYPAVQMSDDTNRWLVELASDNKPSMYYLYERQGKSLKFLFSAKTEWSNHTFSKTYYNDIVTSDGLVEMCYVNFPPRFDASNNGIPSTPLPTVLLVHGGPQFRDLWDFNPMTQFLASRYAVLRCQFRSSMPGFGKIFANAGNGEWGRRMQQDLTDAVNWAVTKKITDPKRIAIVGASYGGYATLAGVTFTPDLYTCAIAIAAPANLITTAKMIPEYWKPELPALNLQMGNDPKDAGGDDFLRSRSPVFFVDRIKIPLMIVHGDQDPRVDKFEAEQMINALKTNTTIPATLLRFPDEGHSIVRQENIQALVAINDQFLAKCLGGVSESITDEITNSSAIVTSYNS